MERIIELHLRSNKSLERRRDNVDANKEGGECRDVSGKSDGDVTAGDVDRRYDEEPVGRASVLKHRTVF
ncbi:unnamed protein product [Gongylonema pulchrum]|uniref:Uncharacterized protein n=1 Tax=Gongylonema pulchrum TaxID=637853 RepID=A0A183D2M7_9BILA|nr:unnamed protein product [Gongylonema pulchrum]